MPNYNFVINSSFQPFTMQEMLTPLLAYKDVFEKTEESYNDLSDKSDKFKYLSETLPEGSKARQLYEGYAGELRKQAEDLAHNGLNMSNRRALTSLKRRYQGEIGRLLQADEAMKEEKKLRQSLNAQDSSRLYATDNLSIDDFLDGSSPNLYNISGNELYTRGAAAGKAASSRVFYSGDVGTTLGGYYRDYVQKMGYNRDTINRFYEDMSAIPELQRAADSILEERGVNKNLSGYNLERARKSVINGMIDGAIYQEQHNPQRDLGKLTAAENKQLELQKRGQDISLGMNGFSYNDSTGAVTYNGVDNDPSVQKAKALAVAKAATKNNSGNSRTTAYNTRNKNTVMVGGTSGNRYKTSGEDGIGIEVEDIANARELSQEEYNKLVDSHGNITNEYIRNAIGNGDLADYQISIIPKGSDIVHHWYRPNTDSDEDIYIITPRESKRAATDTDGNYTDNSESSDSQDTNEIPN